MCSRVAKRRIRRLQFAKNRSKICSISSEEKLLDPNLLNLFEEETKRDSTLIDDSVSTQEMRNKRQARIQLLNGKRSFVATRGVLKEKAKYSASVMMKDGITETLGPFTTNIAAAMAHDRAVRRHWDAATAEKMVNLSKASTRLFSLDSKTSQSLIDVWYERDQIIDSFDVNTLQNFSINNPPWREMPQLHNLQLAESTGGRS